MRSIRAAGALALVTAIMFPGGRAFAAAPAAPVPALVAAADGAPLTTAKASAPRPGPTKIKATAPPFLFRPGALPPSITVQDTSYTFPVTAIGQTSGICSALCFCSDVSACTCDESGVETLDHDLSPPFSAFNYQVQPYAGGAYDCTSGTPVTLPASLAAGQQLTFDVEFSPTAPGTFTDFLTISGFTFNLSGSTPPPATTPSLVPYRPSGWSDSLVVSSSPGTQQDSAPLTSNETLYASWAVLNQGTAPTSVAFLTDLILDGSLLRRWQTPPPLGAGFYAFVKDFAFGPLSPGTHTLELVPDETATAGPSDNYAKTYTIVVAGGTQGCQASATVLCIDDQPGDRRFQLAVSYSTAEGGARSGNGQAIALLPVGVDHGGLFWFFGSDNPEMLVKVLNGCASNNRFWLFFSAGTNVGFTLTALDTATGAQRTYQNPDLTAALPVQDTSAFSCP